VAGRIGPSAADAASGAAPAPAIASPLRSPAVVPSVSAAELRAIIRDVVRDEVQHAAPPAPTAPEEPAVEATPDDPASADRGRAIVGAARHVGRWTEEDAAALRSAMGAMSDAQRSEVLALLVPAINRGELALTFEGPIF